MPESRRLDNSNSSNNAVAVHNGSLQKPSSRHKMHNNYKQEGALTDYPERPGEPNCIYFLRTGSCGYGSNCRYNHPTHVAQDVVCGLGGDHPERDGEPDCGFFMKTGTCKYGSSCKYNHPRDRNGGSPVSFNILGLPMRSEGNPCMYYMRTGQCKFGPACKFHHPQPAVPGPVFPVIGTTPLGSVESSNLPIRTFPALSIPAAAYVYDPRTQTPQPYMPLAISPSEGILPQQGWSTYLGNMSPVSSTNTLGSSPSYNSTFRCLGESGSNGQMHYLSFFTPPYPERPDRPECRYFMNSGVCKYGPDCKYNHPKERIAQIFPQPINPLGFPFRPGQPLCSSYSIYGICRNGPMCKFHHQVGGYLLNCGLSSFPLPLPMPLFDEPIFERRSSTVVISSETSSPSKSPKDLNWMKKPESATERNQLLATNGQQKSHDEEAGTTRNSSPASSTKQHD